ncbi:MAG: hypothetical protein PHW27_09905 [Melioribacteraceae bacterium]|nr:hypothetical protein [Melioribacteraceae bacterium]
MINSSKIDIERFLEEFKQKFKVYGVFFKNREKNEQALYDLEITPKQREEYLLNLEPEDYLSGPIADAFDPNSPDNYEFAITLKSKEVYIKINKGKPGKRVMCISFHISERRVKYPFKKEK